MERDDDADRKLTQVIEGQLRRWIESRRWVATQEPDLGLESLKAIRPVIQSMLFVLEDAYADTPEHLDQLREDLARVFAPLEKEGTNDHQD